MPQAIDDLNSFRAALAGLEQLRRFAGSAAEFWRSYLEALQALTGAAVVTIARRRGEQAPEWGRVGALPATAPMDASLREFWQRVESLAEETAKQNAATIEWVPAGFRRTDRAVAARLEADRDAEIWVAILYFPGGDAAAAAEALRRLQLAAYVPAHFQLRRIASHLQTGEGGAASVLDLVALLNADDPKTRPSAKWYSRIYGIGAQILRELGVGKMRLMAAPRKMPSMAGFGLEVCGYLAPDESLS